MSGLTRFHRVSRVFLARQVAMHGEDSREVPRRLADELDWLADAERRERSAR